MSDQGEKAMAQITYYGHYNRDTGGPILQKHIKQNVDIDVTVTSGAHTGTASSFRAKKVPADLLWLLQEGMDVPVFIDQSGNATALDMDGLDPLVAANQDALDAAHKERRSNPFDIPKREELDDLKEIAGNAGRAVKGLFRRKG